MGPIDLGPPMAFLFILGAACGILGWEVLCWLVHFLSAHLHWI